MLGLANRSQLNAVGIHREHMMYAVSGSDTETTVSKRLGRRACLTRYSNPNSSADTKSILREIFRKEHHIANIFDYVAAGNGLPKSLLVVPPFDDTEDQSLPKAIRGAPFALIRQMQRRHKQTRFEALLAYYCPLNHQRLAESSKTAEYTASEVVMTPENDSILQNATAYHSVTAFVVAALKRLLPHAAFGSKNNFKVLYRSMKLRISVFIEQF